MVCWGAVSWWSEWVGGAGNERRIPSEIAACSKDKSSNAQSVQSGCGQKAESGFSTEADSSGEDQSARQEEDELVALSKE